MELVTTIRQTLQPNESLPFQAVSVLGPSSIVWRQGSNILTVKGLFNNQCRARFKVNFGGDVALSTDSDIEPIILAVAVNGEVLTSSRMTSTPAAVEEFNNVFREIYLDVPTGCCTQISIKNISTVPIDIDLGASIIVERVA